MAAYHYIALSETGKEHKGVLEGDSERQVRQALRAQGLIPTKITSAHDGRETNSSNKYKRRTKIKVSELALMTRQIATLVAAGLPIEEVLQGVAEQTDKTKLKSMLIAIRAKVVEGHTLAAALADFPTVFSNLYRATIAAGETSGNLEQILLGLADYSEKQLTIRQKIKQALIYPSVMSSISILIVIFLLAFVVPKIIDVFTANQQQLPTATLILLTLSDWLIYYGAYLLIACILVVIALRYFVNKYAKVRYALHQFMLKIPLIGNTIKVVNTARFCRTFGILSTAGVPILEAMNISVALISNMPLKEALQKAAARIKEGASIHLALRRTGYFPPMSIHLIATGEGTGQMEQMLQRAADNQDKDVTSLIDNTLALFEPAIILIMGAIVLFIVLAIMLPIFDLNQLTT